MATVPIPLRQVIKSTELAGLEFGSKPLALGSFWVESSRDIQSRIVKFFKSPVPPFYENTAAQTLSKAYADLLIERLVPLKAKGIVRILGSRETRPDPHTPLFHLARELGTRLGIPMVEPFYRSESRKSMRDIPRLSGPDALKPRIEYVLQDLFLLPQPMPSKVILLDDIYNLGASAHVYAAALKRHCGVEEVISVNLAATRFHGGKDGWGYLMLDVERLLASMKSHLDVRSRVITESVYEAKGMFHTVDCPEVERKYPVPRFLVPEDFIPCPACHKTKSSSWWQQIF